MKKTVLCILMILFVICVQAQQKRPTEASEKPKLIVGIIVDQMRFDYLYKYYDKYSENGFKKLLDKGFNCQNTNYNYVPTYTGPGHASIYTGTTPSFHGIIANDWFVRGMNTTTYVTSDSTVQTVGSSSKKAGEMSPKNMLSSTIGDELRLYSNMNSRVISVALKDRSAILPGGHLSNGSYWFDDKTGNFVTSSFYTNVLPKWVTDFNALRLANTYLSQDWNPLFPIEQYTESAPDNNPYEGLYRGETEPVFPHKLPTMFSQMNYEVLRSTPFGNSLTKDIALAALKYEKLGKGESTDFLAISFSSTDYVGHKMGPQSIELEDTYLRLDRDIAEIIAYLEKTYGKDGFLVFLTADHAASYVPEQLIDLKMPAGYFDSEMFTDTLKIFLANNYGDSNLLTCIINEQIYLNHILIKEKGILLQNIQENVAAFALQFKGIANSYTANQLNGEVLRNRSGNLMQNGFYPNRSGDVALLLEPGWMVYAHTGTTHGSSYTYDTHVPLLWYGWHIHQGYSVEPVDIVDIAPTISSLLHIMPPNACTGKPIRSLFK